MTLATNERRKNFDLLVRILIALFVPPDTDTRSRVRI
jgi:hypothetical protein